MSNLYRGSSIDASYQDSYQFADDTQLFNKNDESVKKSFDILTIYEKASGSKVNYEKTKGMYIGSAKNNRPKFYKNSLDKG